jgi:hypothetical protein
VKHHGEQDQAERKDEDEGNGSGDCSPAKEVCRGAVVDLGGGRGTSSRRWLRSPEGSARQLKVEGKNSGRRAPATNDRIAGRTSAPESMNGDARRLGPGGRTAAAAALLTGKRHNVGRNGGSGLLRRRARLASEELDRPGSAECEERRNIGSSQHGRKKK